jgi:transglutaminase-like putative cysteine protease
MQDWFIVVKDGGISNDNLPFVLMVNSLTWLAAYISAWSIFRWHNPWISLIPGGVALLTNISYLDGQPAAAFVCYLFGAILLVMRLHLRKSQSVWRKDGVEYPEFMSLRLLNVTIWLAVALMVGAWVVPLGSQAKFLEGTWDSVQSRFDNTTLDWGRLFTNIKSQRGAPFHTFGPTMPFQGEIDLGRGVDFEVAVDQPGLLKAASYDEYTAEGWKRGDRREVQINPGELSELPASEYREPVTAEVTIQDYFSSLLSVGTPRGVDVPAEAQVVEGAPDDEIAQLNSTERLEEGESYTTTGSIIVAPAEVLRAAGDDYEDWVTQNYLQLPDDLPQRVIDLAAEWTANAATPYDKAAAIRDQLRTYPIDTTIEAPPPGSDGVDYFLFEARAGFFDYHASAMAVLLRTQGVPARIGTGYVLDEYDAAADNFVVRETHSYTWTEVYFPGIGWVEFNPSPEQPLFPSETGTMPGTAGDDPLDGGITPGGQPFPFEIPSQPLPLDPLPEVGTTASADLSGGDGGGFPWMVLWVLAGIAGLAVVVAGGGRLAWERSVRGLDYPSAVWEKTVRLAGWAKLSRSPDDTPREYARYVGDSINERPATVNVAEEYLRARYGRKDLDSTDHASLASDWKRVRNRLVKRIFRIKG